MSKILFFTTAIEHTTFRRTAKMLQEQGAEVHVIGFTRKNFPEGTDNLSIESLGVLSHGNYVSRIIRLFKYLSILRRRAKDYDVIYNFTLDTLIISRIVLFLSNKKWIYQIQDIRPIYFGKSKKSKIARFLEKYFIKNIDLLVVSSFNYYEDHYKDLYGISIDKVYVLENKLDRNSICPEILNSEKDSNRDIITIGYFGVMRCNKSWQILKTLAIEQKNRISLYLRGKPIAMPNIHEEIFDISNITYDGLYKSPDDLNELYNRVDIVWACYPYSERKEGNWRLARTIRFYEALAFRKPVIVQKGTVQENDVVKYNLGLVVDMGDISKTMKQLESITTTDLKVWTDNIDKLDPSYYYYTDEYVELFKKIEELKK